MSTNPPFSPTSSLRDLHDKSEGISQSHNQYGGPEEAPTASELHPGEVHALPPHDNPINSAPSVTSSSQPARNSFQPFFTLVEDAHTTDYHHPTVHYIFSDDDTDIVTEAALRSLEAPSVHKDGPKSDGSEESTLLPPPVPGVRENYIVLNVEPVPSTTPTPDLNPAAGNPNSNPNPNPNPNSNPNSVPDPNSGVGEKTKSTSPGKSSGSNPQFRVTSAKSFSPSWQILSSEMVAAPTFENGNGNPGDAGHGLMLKIRGTGGLAGEIERERGTQRLEDMMDQFAKRMQELQMIIEVANIQDDLRMKEEEEEGDEENEGHEEEEEEDEEEKEKDT
ncbi:uncharacterized protein N7443_005368 [Penicillium atrosanguineum]|uniref:uncharacterized protein n=1 Tax=Penicillium atrosanguineum TaxID=1132637 RepID=UPI002399B2B9|nr:uncharacterized protein N7443_005368 [Penicillium atrosanguineum]KAJ5300366.1 hypothetical protein N7443_005368 [Penicillium atrosanguineum]